MISPFELKQLRKVIGASVSNMAHLLGLSGDNANDNVRKMENGNKSISGPIQRLAKYMQQGVEEGGMAQALPAFMLCSDLADEKQFEWVFHTRYPRFLAVVTPEPIDGLDCATADNLEWICVAIWIDEAIEEPLTYVNKAASLFAEYSNDTMAPDYY